MRKSFFAAAVCSMLVLGAAAAQAETVAFNTDGTFSGGTTTANSPVVSSIVFGTGADTTTITFTSREGGLLMTPSTESLGVFNVTGTGNGASTGTGTFLLTINQTAPDTASGSFGQATLSGTVTLFSSSARIQFDNPTSLALGTLPPITYSILGLDAQQGLSLARGERGTSIEASITAVPLPAAAWGGLALLGTLGGARLRKRRQNSMSL